MKFGDSPCNGCPDRKVGCHGRCDRYRVYDRDRQMIRRHRLLAHQGRPDKQRLSNFIKESNKHYKSKGKML